MNRIALTFPVVLFMTSANALCQQPASAPTATEGRVPTPMLDPELKRWQDQWMKTHDSRIAWWKHARFGMFIHWGVYSVPAGEWKGQKQNHIGEWIMLSFHIPVAEYKALTKQFNPVKFDADQWVQLAKDAGMKYIVITAKHHDGFAMFKSQASDYNIVDATPFKRDPLKELAEACRKHGIKLGFYYSQAQDWAHPGGAAAGRAPEPGVTSPKIPGTNHWDPAQEGSMDQYIDRIAMPQVREILTNYGEIAVLWWDTPMGMTTAQSKRFLPLLELQPNIIINNRLDASRRLGDFETPEQRIPPTGVKGVDWETCMTMNRTWGYKAHDDQWKSTATLLRNLIDIASKGGNYLLNVGPTSEGLIPEPSVERLKDIGQWMKTNGESIYGTSANPFDAADAPGWTAPLNDPKLVGRITRKVQAEHTTLYLHVFKWPTDAKVHLPELKNEIESVTLLSSGAALQATTEGGATTIALPPTPPDPIASTIAVKVKGAL
jgi:alpha-L-fucosidase